MLPLMEMVCYCLGNLSKLPNTVCNHFGQPLMEMVSNRCRQPRQVTQHSMQPVYATTHGNGMLPLMKWYVTAYGNGMLPLYAT
jgi:hypothetical protein